MAKLEHRTHTEHHTQDPKPNFCILHHKNSMIQVKDSTLERQIVLFSAPLFNVHEALDEVEWFLVTFGNK